MVQANFLEGRVKSIGPWTSERRVARKSHCQLFRLCNMTIANKGGPALLENWARAPSTFSVALSKEILMCRWALLVARSCGCSWCCLSGPLPLRQDPKRPLAANWTNVTREKQGLKGYKCTKISRNTEVHFRCWKRLLYLKSKTWHKGGFWRRGQAPAKKRRIAGHQTPGIAAGRASCPSSCE